LILINESALDAGTDEGSQSFAQLRCGTAPTVRLADLQRLCTSLANAEVQQSGLVTTRLIRTTTSGSTRTPARRYGISRTLASG
jgi:hypothetical protein